MKVVIAGCGRTGALTAAMLAKAGHAVTVIDQDSRAFRRLPEDFSGTTVHGNVIEQDTLRAAGVHQAEVYLAATTGDNRNIMTSQIAKTILSVPRVITRIKDPERAALYRELGLEVDCRTTAGAQVVLDILELAAE